MASNLDGCRKGPHLLLTQSEFCMVQNGVYISFLRFLFENLRNSLKKIKNLDGQQSNCDLYCLSPGNLRMRANNKTIQMQKLVL